MIVDFTCALSAEIKSVSEKFKNYSIKSIFFGGGTPSYLDEYSLKNIYEQINSSYDIDPNVEFSIEVNPTDLNEKKLKLYESIGINRISLGGQSFEDEILIKLGRNHDSKDLETSLNILQDSYIKNINLDLIFGVPDQTIEHWKKTLDKFLSYSLPHLSAYCLTFEPKTKYFRDLKLNKISSPPENLLVKMFNYNSKTLPKSNYEQYEISNVSKPGRKCRHNLKYWTDGEWLGFGCGAHSTRGGARWSNISETSRYIENVTSGQDVALSQRCLSDDERLGDALFMGLRLTEGLDISLIEQRYGISVMEKYRSALAPFIEKKRLLYESGRLRLSREGMLIANDVMGAFV